VAICRLNPNHGKRQASAALPYMDVGYGDHVGNIGRPEVSGETRKAAAMPLEWHT
jgi:hypothetical protein